LQGLGNTSVGVEFVVLTITLRPRAYQLLLRDGVLHRDRIFRLPFLRTQTRYHAIFRLHEFSLPLLFVVLLDIPLNRGFQLSVLRGNLLLPVAPLPVFLDPAGLQP